MIRYALVIALLTSPAVADDTYGAVAGGNIVEFSETGLNHTRIKVRPTVGAFYRFVRRSVMIDLGLQYSWRRIDWTVCGLADCDDAPDPTDGARTFHDLELPVLVRFPAAHNPRFRASVALGLAPWLVLKKTESIEMSAPQPLSNMSAWDLAVVGGFGFERRSGGLWMGLELRGSVGMTARYQISDNDPTGTTYAAYALFTVVHEPTATQ